MRAKTEVTEKRLMTANVVLRVPTFVYLEFLLADLRS